MGDEAFCRHAVERTVEAFGRLDILVNNAAEQHETKDPLHQRLHPNGGQVVSS